MTAVASQRQPARARTPWPVMAAIAAAWALAVAAQATDTGGGLHHDTLIGSRPPLWLALPLFLVAWQAMFAAMMLPSSLPLIRLFHVASQGQHHVGRVRAAFMAGYAAVWTLFGAAAFLADVGIHRTVARNPWVADRSWLIATGVLAIAGGFQFSSLKERCLSKCRHPAPYLLAHYRRGAGGGFRLGFGHGLFCLGCCWALMLVMFAAGVAVLWWMAVLTAVMVYEKTGRHGEAMTPVVGIALLGLAALSFTHPFLLGTPFGHH